MWVTWVRYSLHHLSKCRSSSPEMKISPRVIIFAQSALLYSESERVPTHFVMYTSLTSTVRGNPIRLTIPSFARSHGDA